MRKFFLTLDLEEWYHLEYFQHLVNKNERVDIFISLLDDFFNLLDKYNIKITIFALAELVEKYPEIINKIVTRGHEVACHGLNHGLLYEKSDQEFKNEIARAKSILEEISGQNVVGYRAPCYSMEDNKLPILKELGFKYDSSFIRFSQHDLYKMMNLDGFQKKEDLIYEKDGFFEYEIPTYKINKFNIPISGGGYFRLIPNIVYRKLFESYIGDEKNFVFYIHPFELNPQKIKIPNVNLTTKFRFSVGRKKVLSNMELLIKMAFKNGFTFHKMNEFI